MNPLFKNYEYVPDGEPHVFDGRLYLFGSHDQFNSKWTFCVNDYVVYSSSLDDPANFRFEGVSYKKTQDPYNVDGKLVLYAPDVVKGNDGKFYLYYGLADFLGIGVAKANKPQGPYEFIGYVHDKNGVELGRREGDKTPFDPAVINDDGIIRLYAGQGPLSKRDYEKNKKVLREFPFHIELEDDMVTMKTEPIPVIPSIVNSKGTDFEGHEFFEGSSIRKFNNKYYFIYSSINSHELCYGISDHPYKNYKYGGRLISNGDIFTDINIFKAGSGSPLIKNYSGNNHGSIECINGEYYIFYHRHTNRRMFSRQACAAKIEMDSNGMFKQALMTTSGLEGDLKNGTYHASSACQLYSKKGACFSAHPIVQNKKHPAFTQDEDDSSTNETQYIDNFLNGATAVYKYFDLTNTNSISIKVRGKGIGYMEVSDENGTLLAKIDITKPSKDYVEYSSSFTKTNSKELYFVFKGRKAVDFVEFTLS